MVLLLLLSACAVGVGVPVPGDDRPDAGPSTADARRGLAALTASAAALAVREERSGEQFGAAFAYGEGAGLHEDLPGLLRRAGALPVGLRGPFIDGAAHTWAPPDSVPLVVVAHNIDASLPVPWREPFHNGVFVSASIAAGGDPAVIVPRVEAYAEAHGHRPLDGVRIGLQRAAGDDLASAIGLAATFPDAYQAALFEELGWRAGDDGAQVCALAAAVPTAERCAFVHGAARGRTLVMDWEAAGTAAALGEAVDAAACGCTASAWRGVAWGLALRWGHRPPRAQTLARRVDGAVPGAHVEAALGPLLEGPRPAPWVGIGG